MKEPKEKMRCPVCGGATMVRGSHSECDNITRRRYCVECKHHFSTIEIDEDYYIRLLNMLNQRSEGG